MGDFAVHTAIEALGGGRYRTCLCPDWEIWGPMGGYAAAIVMRAVGAEATHERPASFFCHFLSGMKFDELELRVVAMRRGRSAESLRVLVTQHDREVMDATVCLVADVDGLEHEVTMSPASVPGWKRAARTSRWASRPLNWPSDSSSANALRIGTSARSSSSSESATAPKPAHEISDSRPASICGAVAAGPNERLCSRSRRVSANPPAMTDP